MKTIQKVGRLQPRIVIEWYRTHPLEWKKLKQGEKIEVPNDVFEELVGVEEVPMKKSKRNKSLEVFEEKLEEDYS